MNERTGCIVAIGLVLLVLCLGAIAIGSAGGDWVEDLLGNADNAHYERMREMELGEAEQNRKAAEAEVEVAEAALAQAQAEADREEAYARQMEQRVQLETATGQRAQDEADAYTTKKMADAAYKAIQRQGHLLSLSVAQQYFFGGVMGLSLLAVVALALVVLNERKMKR